MVLGQRSFPRKYESHHSHPVDESICDRKECNSSPALQEVLNTIREAWTEPTLLFERCCRVWMKPCRSAAVQQCEQSSSSEQSGDMMQRRAQLSELALPGASPGLLRRRYSMPETIMRKYRLAQQKSECESIGHDSPASACPGRGLPPSSHCGCESPPGRGVPRRAALLRRLWARPPPCTCCADASSREARSLGCSRAEIACSSPGPGWATPKRQRLDDDMLRAAMRNSYDDRKSRADLSDSTYQSHTRDISSPVNGSLERLTTSVRPERRSRDVFAQYSEGDASGTATPDLYSPTRVLAHTPTSPQKSSFPAFNGFPSAAPTYEVLEIVVSETFSGDSPLAINVSSPERKSSTGIAVFHGSNVDIDQYVSNILVESLNSLNDQLESMNASIGGDRKISIVEKEIKVKLQNTGVNTIVHLSPTSNNQIIFGNEELYHAEERRDSCNNLHSMPRSADTNDNLTSADTHARCDQAQAQPESLTSLNHQDSVNRVVLQQIQKLFQDELDQFEPSEFQQTPTSDISRIEISNVDVYIKEVDENDQSLDRERLIVGGGNYFPSSGPLVPRLSALPDSVSMEVNTSSSEGDTGRRVSDCTSLVDSLDDPSSPRTDLLACGETRKLGLVCSSIDVLDLMRHSDHSDRSGPRSETFYIRIRDNDCDCEKENIIVADHMPEKIKQKLYRRHRRRELRMECARRSRIKQVKRDFDKQRSREAYRSKREIDRECAMTLNALIDEVIAKIAQDEYKCMRIKRRPIESVAKSTENLARRTRRKDMERGGSRDSIKLIDNSSISLLSQRPEGETLKSKRRQIHGKLSLQTRTSPTFDDRGPKRVYQKSEIHDGNKRIEILEILEYADTSPGSTETTTSDENQNYSLRNKKSRIPIPIFERSQRLPRVNSQSVPSLDSGLFRQPGPGPGPGGLRRASLPQETRFRRVFDAIPEERSSLSLDSADDAPPRRLSAPTLPADPPSSPVALQPSLTKLPLQNSPKRRPNRSAATSPTNDKDRNTKLRSQMTMTSPCRKSAATSPMQRHSPESGNRVSSTTKSTSYTSSEQTTCSLTSGTLRAGSTTTGTSTATTTTCGTSTCDTCVTTPSGAGSGRRGLAARGRAWLGFSRSQPDDAGMKSSKEKIDETNNETNSRKSASTQCEVKRSNPVSTVRTMLGEKTQHVIVGANQRRVATNTHRKDSNKSISDKNESNKKKPSNKTNVLVKKSDKKKIQMISVEESEQERIEEERGERRSQCSSDSGSEGSLLCALAPRWLAHARHKRRRPAPAHPSPPNNQHESGNWSVTVAGSCRAPMPADVEMRLRFPDPQRRCDARDAPADTQHAHYSLARMQQQDCTCRYCCSPPRLPPAPHSQDICKPGKLTFTMKKEALDSSILASKSRKKSCEPLPELESYRASRTKTKSSVKTRRGYSLHCWLPDTNNSSPTRSRNSLSVSGSAIVPEMKPRAPTMSERDLTRLYTPRLYLRS